MISCKHEPDAGNIPLMVGHLLRFTMCIFLLYFTRFLYFQFMDPVYGQKDTPYTEFMAPGLIISQVLLVFSKLLDLECIDNYFF
jgi:hypothetical protein